MGAYQRNKPAVSSFSLGAFFVLTNSIHPHSHSAAVYSLCRICSFWEMLWHEHVCGYRAWGSELF